MKNNDGLENGLFSDDIGGPSFSASDVSGGEKQVLKIDPEEMKSLINYIDSGQINIKTDLAEVSQRLKNDIEGVKVDLGTIHKAIQSLNDSFTEYMEQSGRAQRKQYANTDLVRVRQEIASKFGANDSIRRYAVSILQADDAQIVRKETFINCTENLMMQAPKYWLAPCLVTVGAWLNSDAQLAARAVNEAIRRDEEKSCMFFSLVTRRMGHLRESIMWLERYFRLQDPYNLGRKVIVIINAFSEGLFGEDTQRLCINTFYEWRDRLLKDAALVAEQKDKWIKFYVAKAPEIPKKDFGYIRQYVVESEGLLNSLSYARMHIVIYDFFRVLFTAKAEKADEFKDEIDKLLTSLVTNFDAEEYALKKQEKYCELLIRYDGNEKQAQKDFAIESDAMEENYNFLNMLMCACQTPETVNASPEARRLSFAFSKDLIAHSYSEMTERVRKENPKKVTIKIVDWEGKTEGAENIEELKSSLNRYIKKVRRQDERKLRLPLLYFVGVLVLGGLITLLAMNKIYDFAAGTVSLIYLIPSAIVAGAYLIWFLIMMYKKLMIWLKFREFRDKCRNILKSTTEEIMDLRAEYWHHDPVADKIINTVLEVTPEKLLEI